MIHDFKERLSYSEVASDEPFWESVYRKAFPNFVSMALGSGDTVSQRMGIDRIILLANGKVIKIDEKKRSKAYSDILIEYISADTTNAPGWIEKDLPIDYLSYAFMPTQKVYIFPWDMLRRAWMHYKADWITRYKIPPAVNKTYNTFSVAVPIAELHNAVKQAMIIQL